MDVPWQPCTEPSLALDQWRALLAYDPIRACRRYCHQVKLATLGQPALRSSIATFQQLTQREPDRFLAQALTIAQHCIHPPAGAERSQRQQWLWHQITIQPYQPTDPYMDFASPYVLIDSVISQLAILSDQARYLQMNFPPRPLDDLSSNSHEDISQSLVSQRKAKNRAGVQSAWHEKIWMLAIAIEEAQLPHALPLVRSEAQQPSVLAPYPDEAEWSELLNTNRVAAVRRFWELELEVAKSANHLCFNLGESIATFHALRAQERRAE